MSPRLSAATRFKRQIATGSALYAAASTRGLARAIAHAAQDAGENVRLAIQEIRVVESALCDQPNVLGYVGVRGARPLTVDDPVEILGTRCVRGFHQSAPDRNRLE